MDRDRVSGGGGQRLGQLAAGHADRAAARGRLGGLGWKEATHHQDVLRVDEAAQLSRLLEGRDGQRGGASLESRVSDRYCAVSVAAGLYDREQSCAPRKVAEDALAVGADGAEVDVSPAQRRLQRPPWRST